jgi:hypothetical protein
VLRLTRDLPVYQAVSAEIVLVVGISSVLLAVSGTVVRRVRGDTPDS